MRQLEKVVCNCCGKEFYRENGVIKSDIVSIDKAWGYFSKKDGTIHSLDLCENCYDEIIKTFKIAPTIKKQTEYV